MPEAFSELPPQALTQKAQDSDPYSAQDSVRSRGFVCPHFPDGPDNLIPRNLHVLAPLGGPAGWRTPVERFLFVHHGEEGVDDVIKNMGF